MQKRNVLRGVAAAFAAAVTIGALGTAAAVADLAARPISGSADGVVTDVLGPGHLVIDYTGSSSHLGTFTRREEVQILPDGSLAGTLVFVASNGDELDASLTGQFVSANDLAGTYTFTGGTGRFADASGTASFSASTPDFVHVSVTFAGTIGY